MSISAFLTSDHRSCDHRLVEVENAASRAQWDEATTAFGALRDALVGHLAMEETVLFPALEAPMGGPFGPTMVMRAEHAQMRQLLAAAEGDLGARNQKGLLGDLDTLMTLVQQHNMKEERILYPMADRALPDGAEVEARMAALRPAQA